jgi:Fur family zinc uptake transcriptional regulator
MRCVIKNPAPPAVYRALYFLLEQGLMHKLESLHTYVDRHIRIIRSLASS